MNALQVTMGSERKEEGVELVASEVEGYLVAVDADPGLRAPVLTGTKLPNIGKPTGSHNVFTHVRRIRIVIFATRPKLHMQYVRDRPHDRSVEAFDDLIKADHEIKRATS